MNSQVHLGQTNRALYFFLAINSDLFGGLTFLSVL